MGGGGEGGYLELHVWIGGVEEVHEASQQVLLLGKIFEVEVVGGGGGAVLTVCHHLVEEMEELLHLKMKNEKTQNPTRKSCGCGNIGNLRDGNQPRQADALSRPKIPKPQTPNPKP